MVGPNGLEPSTSSVSRKRSNQTELRAYIEDGCGFNFTGRRVIRATLVPSRMPFAGRHTESAPLAVVGKLRIVRPVQLQATARSFALAELRPAAGFARNSSSAPLTSSA